MNFNEYFVILVLISLCTYATGIALIAYYFNRKEEFIDRLQAKAEESLNAEEYQK